MCHTPLEYKHKILNCFFIVVEGDYMKDTEQKQLDKEIDKLYKQLNPIHGGRKEDYLGVYYIQRKWGLSVEDAAKQVTFGGNDFGVDGFHFDEKRKTFIIYQFKYTADYKQFKGTYKRLIDEGMKLIFESPNQKNYNSIITVLNNTLTTNRPIIKQLAFHFVFLGDCEKAENSKVLVALQENLEGKKYLIDQRFNCSVPFSIQYISTENIGTQDDKGESSIGFNEGKIYDAPKTHEYELDVSDSIHYTGDHNESMTVCFLKLTQLYNILYDMGNRLFDRNIRYGLGGTKSANRAIKESLKSVMELKQSPKDFLFNHNGITISATDVVDLNDDKIKIVEPRILNGAQTLSTYKEFRDNNFDNDSYKKNLSKLDEINVLCKIIHSDFSEFIVNVTINNNRQNPVEPWALHANDLIQLHLVEIFQGLDIFYERQEKAYKNLGWKERGEKGITDNKVIEIVKLAQTFMAAEGRIHLVSNRRNIFENKKYYDSIFCEDRLKADFRLIVLCYKIQKNLNAYKKTIIAKGPVKFSSIDKAGNLLWSLLCQGILNEFDEDIADNFGSNMTITDVFKDYFKHLASSKCRELLSDLLTEKADDIKNEKYGFLKTETSFKFCMQKANEKYGWNIKPLK
jgi:hypothetical protein